MAALENLVLVFIAGFITALATGIGALPFFIVDRVNDRLNVVLWGLASGIMVSASVFGLISEGLAEAQSPSELILVGVGLVAGVLLVIVGHRVITGAEIDPQQYAEADFKKLVLILGILTIHSFPEGVAIGVSFAELNFNIPDALQLLGFTIPLLAVFMTIAISIHNIPEGVAISIPLQAMGVSKWRMVWWDLFEPPPADRGGDRVLLRQARPAVPAVRLRPGGRGHDLPRPDRIHSGGDRDRRGSPRSRPS